MYHVTLSKLWDIKGWFDRDWHEFEYISGKRIANWLNKADFLKFPSELF
jgi:hypothetical protein